MRNLLLLHGAIGSSRQLRPLQEKLAGDYAVHLMDFPGHGGTPMPERFSVPRFAAAVKDYLVQKGLTDVSLFGYSMGGYVALYLAQQYPGIIQKIITLATKFHWDEATAAAEVKMLQSQAIEQKVPQFAQALQERHAPGDWKAVLQLTAGMLTAMGKENPLPPDVFPGITAPCLLLLGDRDKMVTLEETTTVFRNLPNAQLSVLPGTAHPIESVDAALLAYLIKRFVG